jgi:hypothetical protein
MKRMAVRIVRQRVSLGGSEAGAECGQLLGRPVCAEADRFSKRPVRRNQIVVRQLGELVEDIMRTPVGAVFLISAFFLLGNDVIVAHFSL